MKLHHVHTLHVVSEVLDCSQDDVGKVENSFYVDDIEQSASSGEILNRGFPNGRLISLVWL